MRDYMAKCISTSSRNLRNVIFIIPTICRGSRPNAVVPSPFWIGTWDLGLGTWDLGLGNRDLLVRRKVNIRQRVKGLDQPRRERVAARAYAHEVRLAHLHILERVVAKGVRHDRSHIALCVRKLDTS